MVKSLIECSRIEVNFKNEKGQTALSLAAEKGHTEVVKLLLERDEVKVNPADNSHALTALGYATINGHTEMFKMLLERNEVNIHLKDFSKRRGLLSLARGRRRRHTEIVSLLLERDAIEGG